MKRILSTIFLLCTLSMFAQGPNNIIVESCVERDVVANGTYTKGTNFNGCDCYDKDEGGGRISWSSNPSGFFYDPNNPCENIESKVSTSIPIKDMNADCSNILLGESSNACIVIAPQTIPTLSEWAIIILSILMVILGVNAVYKKVRLVS